MTREIPLTRGQFALVDEDDYAWLLQCNSWQCSNAGYAVSHKDKKLYYMHRLIMNPPIDMVVDHINGNKIDNRKKNLRVCTQSQNHMNRSANSKKMYSSYKGVTKHKKADKWIAQTAFNSKRIYIGIYECEHLAALAYNEKVYELFGEYAKLNIIDIKR